MMNNATNGDMPRFCTVREAVEATGLSEAFLRAGLKNGKIPHIRSGKKYLINVSLFQAELENMSRCNENR